MTCITCMLEKSILLVEIYSNKRTLCICIHDIKYIYIYTRECYAHWPSRRRDLPPKSLNKQYSIY